MHYRRLTNLMQIGVLAVLLLFAVVGNFAISKGFLSKVLRGDVVLIIWPFVFLTQILPELLARKRYVAAKEAGLILCSKCEYPIKPTQVPLVCPECGVVRSAAEHRKVDNDWRFWVK